MPIQYERERAIGVAGSQIYFNVNLRNASDSKLFDDDNWTQNSQKPRVTILDPDDNIVFDSNVDGNTDITRRGVGRWANVWLVPTNSELTRGVIDRIWKIRWHFLVNGEERIVAQEFDVSSEFKHTFEDVDARVGMQFNNPDFKSDHYYPGWGLVVTPDEIRYGLFFGNDLTAPNGDWFTNSMIQWYIDNGIGSVEADLNLNIVPRIYRCRPIPQYIRGNNGVQQNVRTDFNAAGEDFEWQDPYDYDMQTFENFMYMKLRHAPIIKFLNAKFIDPTGRTLMDLLEWAKVNHESGSVEFFPQRANIGSFPTITLGGSMPLQTFGSLKKYPDAFMIDYIAGYEKVRMIPKEIIACIWNVASWNILNDIGDGRSAALASSSVSLAGISESYSTTQSATSALYGARLESIGKWLKQFYNRNRDRWSGVTLTGV